MNHLQARRTSLVTVGAVEEMKRDMMKREERQKLEKKEAKKGVKRKGERLDNPEDQSERGQYISYI